MDTFSNGEVKNMNFKIKEFDVNDALNRGLAMYKSQSTGKKVAIGAGVTGIGVTGVLGTIWFINEYGDKAKAYFDKMSPINWFKTAMSKGRQVLKKKTDELTMAAKETAQMGATSPVYQSVAAKQQATIKQLDNILKTPAVNIDPKQTAKIWKNTTKNLKATNKILNSPATKAIIKSNPFKASKSKKSKKIKFGW
jgi:hypothetical protein